VVAANNVGHQSLDIWGNLDHSLLF
jgi:hypothetical protein